MKHLTPCFLTTFVPHMYLEVLFEKCGAYKSEYIHSILVRDARESIGQTQPERNPSLLVRYAIRMTFYEKAFEVSWWTLCLERSRSQNPWGQRPLGFCLWTSLGTTVTMIPPRLFQIMSQWNWIGRLWRYLTPIPQCNAELARQTKPGYPWVDIGSSG